MKHGISVLGLIAILLEPLAARATPLLNIDQPELRTGFVANFLSNNELLSYEAATNHLIYSVSGLEDYSDRLICEFPCVPTHVFFNGILEWSATVDEQGMVTDPGSMLWRGDFGFGLETLASGSLQRVGSHSSGPGVEPGTFQFDNLQFLFNFNFLDPRVSGMGTGMLLLFEQEFHSTFDTPFHEDFVCGGGHETFFPTLPRCSYFSTSGALGVSVPEPNSLVLTMLGFLGVILGFAVRRRYPMTYENREEERFTT